VQRFSAFVMTSQSCNYLQLLTRLTCGIGSIGYSTMVLTAQPHRRIHRTAFK